MTEGKATADEVAGMYWWNSMTEKQRSAALQMAKANSIAEAWDWQKDQLADGQGIDVKNVVGKLKPITQDAKSWEAGYKNGHGGTLDETPKGVDGLAYTSGLIEGQADRAAGRVRPLSRKPQP